MTGAKAVWAYPWDLVERGAEAELAELARYGYDTVSVAAAYHAVQALAPENPRRLWYTRSSSTLHFAADRGRYGAVAPLPAQAGEPFAAAAEAAAGAGLALVAWLVVLHTSLAAEHPGLAVRPLGSAPLGGYLCPAQPAVVEYAAALAADVASRFAPAALDLETAGYGGSAPPPARQARRAARRGRAYLAALCWCDACARMGPPGVEAEAERRLRRELRGEAAAQTLDELLDESPALAERQRGRESAVGALLRPCVRPPAFRCGCCTGATRERPGSTSPRRWPRSSA